MAEAQAIQGSTATRDATAGKWAVSKIDIAARLVTAGWRRTSTYLGFDFDSTLGYPGEGQPDGAPVRATIERSVVATFNVQGRMRLKGREREGGEEEWGTGADLRTEATRDWNRIEKMMEGRALVVLTDLCVSGKQLRAMKARLEERRDGMGAWKCFGTPGTFNPAVRRWTGGVLVVWDERCYTKESSSVVMAGRVVEVKLQDCRAKAAFTVLGAYMPTRGKPNAVVERAWEKLAGAAADAGAGRMVIGDLNAEFETALAREERTPRRADELMQHLAGDEFMVTVGPDQETYASDGACSQIDHILCDDYVAAMAGEGRVLPGLSENDHRWLEVDMSREVDARAGPSRCVKLPLWELGKEEWKKFEEQSIAAANNALRVLGYDASPAEKLRAVEKAWEAVVQPWLSEKRKQRDRQKQAAPGSGHRSAEERLRSDVGRWEALTRVVRERDATHRCFELDDGKGGRRSFAKVKEFTGSMQADNFTPEQRRVVLMGICERELARAKGEYQQIEDREGDGLLEAMEEAIREGGEGGVQVRLFEILKLATGKGKKIKWRRAKQEGKTQWKGRGRPPVRLRSRSCSTSVDQNPG